MKKQESKTYIAIYAVVMVVLALAALSYPTIIKFLVNGGG